MFPFLAPLISGAASLMGSMFSSNTSAQNNMQQIAAQKGMQQESEQFNAGQADINRQFQAQQSSTAYQRASADMQAAGLNPSAMFGSGSAASSPSGSSASIGTPTASLSQAKGALSGLGPAVEQALTTAVQSKQIDLLSSQVAKNETEKDVMSRLAPIVRSKQTAETGEVEARTRKEIATLPTARLSGQLSEDVLSADPTWRRNAVLGGFYGQKLGEMTQPISQLISSASAGGRLANAFSDLKTSSQNRKLKGANFVDKYGVPVDEYLAQ